MIHNADDDRVAYQEAEALRKIGDEVFIFSAYEQKEKGRDEKKSWLYDHLREVSPDVIVCDTPVSVCVARRVAKNLQSDVKIVYDITEWYPSKKNLRNASFFGKVLRFFYLSLLSLLAGFYCDAFIFGEYYKSFPFRFLFPWKRMMFLSYYAPVGRVLKRDAKQSLKDGCVLYYSGNLTEEKGYFRVLSVAKKVAAERPSIPFELKVISSETETEVNDLLPNLKVSYSRWMPFPDFCHSVSTGDVFFDLRDNDFENTHCLPIKLFYYMSAGRPMVYSDLKAIRKGVPEFAVECLVDPMDENEIVNTVLRYVDNPEIYRMHCQNNLNLSSLKYNWENIEGDFLKFIHDGF